MPEPNLSSLSIPASVATTASEHSPDPVVFLTADKLLLPDVPEHARESVREFLRPFLPSIPVKNGDCWRIARQLMQTANSPRVGYVEGVWTRPMHHLEHMRGECDCEEYQTIAGAPHAWNTVDGHLVDLVVEFKFSDWTPCGCEECSEALHEWWHEPLKSYSLEEFEKWKFFRDWAVKFFKKNASKRDRKALIDDIRGDFSITPRICVLGQAKDFGLDFSREDRIEALKDVNGTEDYVFKPANDRFVARVNEWLHQQQENAA